MTIPLTTFICAPEVSVIVDDRKQAGFFGPNEFAFTEIKVSAFVYVSDLDLAKQAVDHVNDAVLCDELSISIARISLPRKVKLSLSGTTPIVEALDEQPVDI
jgi:hypothetical protein